MPIEWDSTYLEIRKYSNKMCTIFIIPLHEHVTMVQRPMTIIFPQDLSPLVSPC